MESKIQFFYKFYSIAVREIEEYKLPSSVAEFLEFEWENYVKWYQNVYPSLYRDSISWDYRNFGGEDYV